MNQTALLKEVHHRVTNHLQVVASLLALQAGQLTDPTARATFVESENRIHAIALIHEMLYQSDKLSTVNLDKYLQRLVPPLFWVYNAQPDHITLLIDCEPICLPVDQLVLCGLMVNELVVNALKHAFPAGRTGQVIIRAYAQAAGAVKLTVADTGVGWPTDFDPTRSASLGLKLVDRLVRQLGGVLKWDGQQVAVFDLTFR
jgi:two-component sensor histidine kinase